MTGAREATIVEGTPTEFKISTTEELSSSIDRKLGVCEMTDVISARVDVNLSVVTVGAGFKI